MVQIRKPVKLSENIIDRRLATSWEVKAARAAAEQLRNSKLKLLPGAGSDDRNTKAAAARLQAELLAEAISQAMKLRQQRPR